MRIPLLISLLVAGQLLAQPVILTQPTNQIIYGGSNVTFSVVVLGTAPFAYQWRFNGTNLPNDIITTVVGTGLDFYSGDGGSAANATLRTPYNLAFDIGGNFLITDSHNEAIRKVDTNGIIITVAGHGGSGYSGDGGPATTATMNTPVGIAVDVFGNYYISDNWNQHIRKVDFNGVISSVAGTGTGFPDGVGYSGDGGAATNASLAWPCGVALDLAGNLYIADSGNNRIRKLDTNGVITTVAGNGTNAFTGDGAAATNACLNNPQGVTVDQSGNLYVADSSNNRIRKVDANGIITTVAGNGAASFTGDGGLSTNASLNSPTDAAFDSAGNLYIADSSNHRIRRVDVNGVITTVAGNGNGGYNGDGGPATNTSFGLYGIAVDAPGNLYFADPTDARIREVHFTGLPTRSLKNVSTNNAGNYSVVISNAAGSVTSSVVSLTVVFRPQIADQPTNQAVFPGSNVTFSVIATGTPTLNYCWLNGSTIVQSSTNDLLTLNNVTTNDAGNYTVIITNSYGAVTSSIAQLVVGYPPVILMQPTNQTVLMGSMVAFNVDVSKGVPLTYQWQFNGTNLPNNIITTFAGNGTSSYSGDGGPASNASLILPYGVAADSAGNIFIADQNNNRVRKVDVYGVITTVAGAGIPGFTGDGGTATNARLNAPYAVALDPAGGLFIADQANNRVRKMDTNGIITTVAGKSSTGFSGDGGAATNATLNSPAGLFVDVNGNLYFADQSNNRIRMVGTNGVITTVAGNGTATFAGDGGLATNASLRNPMSVAVDQSGNLIIADRSNNRIRKVDMTGIITTLAGNGSPGFGGDGGLATNAILSSPYGVIADASGNVFIADTSNSRIRKVDASGIVTTIAGTNVAGFSGDGGLAAAARLSFPHGLALDAGGNLLMADVLNYRIRKVTLGSPVLLLPNLAATNAGNYSVIITTPYGSVTSLVATLTVLLPPAIVSQPTSQFIGLGSNATFSVSATGTQPLSYLWQINGVIQSDQTHQSLNLTNVQWSDAGAYQVVITNNYGSITSAVATLTVGVPPSILTQPTNQLALVDGNDVLSVQVAGDGPFTYQWQFNGTNLPPIITTVAGTGPPGGFSGDGGAATDAKLNFPQRLAMDATGNLLIDDTVNNRVRRVGTNGIITTIAGTGTFGYSGNGGPATNANIYANGGLGADGRGNFFIAEFNGGRVCKVDTNGIITLVAGGGSSYGENISATSAAINGAQAVAVDKTGNLFIADYYYYRIRKVGTNGLMTTVAGNPTATGIGGFSGDGGRATNATMGTPYDVAVDSLGNFYIADNANSRIRKVDTNGIVNTVIGGGAGSADGLQGTNTYLFSPVAVAADSFNNLYVTSNGRVRKMDTNGVMTTVAGGGNNDLGDYGPATSARFGNPMGLTFDVQGNLYVAEQSRQRIRKVHFSGDSTLTLVNVNMTNSGNYSVLITSAFGSVVGSVANLTVVTRPVIQIFNQGGGQIAFTWGAVSNLNYQLQYNLDLDSTNWIDLGGPINATNGSVSVSDVIGTNAQRFYRVRLVP